MKKCSKCNQNKSVESFAPRASAKDGRRGVCRECISLQRQERLSDPEKRQKRNQSNRESYYRNHERSKERARANAVKSRSKPEAKERIKQYNKSYNAANLDKFRGYEAEKRALKELLPTEKFTHEEIFERDGWICQICYEPVPQDLTNQYDPMYPNLDHIVALKANVPLEENPGHVRANVRLTHRICNIQKSNK